MLSAGKAFYQQIEKQVIEATINSVKLFDDPNVRVQAVIDNQGVAINDALVSNEVSQGVLHFYEDVVLQDYGYCLVYPEQALEQLAERAFRDWVVR